MSAALLEASSAPEERRHQPHSSVNSWAALKPQYKRTLKEICSEFKSGLQNTIRSVVLLAKCLDWTGASRDQCCFPFLTAKKMLEYTTKQSCLLSWMSKGKLSSKCSEHTIQYISRCWKIGEQTAITRNSAIFLFLIELLLNILCNFKHLFQSA